jgi:hypothetical protein
VSKSRFFYGNNKKCLEVKFLFTKPILGSNRAIPSLQSL